MKFTKELLLELLDYNDGESTEDGYQVIQTKVIDDSRRWVLVHEMIFAFNDSYYATYFETAKHEDGDVRPYEFDGDEIECEEVFPVEVTVTEFMTAKDRDDFQDALDMENYEKNDSTD